MERGFVMIEQQSNHWPFRVAIPVIASLLFSTTLFVATAQANSSKANRILVDKSERTLILYRNGQPLRTYPISLGLNPLGHKQYEGDRRTPEGIYRIDARNSDSSYYLSLRISYPNRRDVQSAQKKGRDPGGQIMIHGSPNGRLIKTSANYSYDWTDGCIAVSNAAMEEIWRMVEVGTLIEIAP